MDLEESAVALDDLLLDPNNYRFQDDADYVPKDRTRYAEQSVQVAALARLQREGLRELKASILHNGFLTFERVIVQRDPDSTGKYVVLEGNRRVGALMQIASDHAAGVTVRDDVLAILPQIPVIVAGGLGDDPALALSLMGVRHVGGIREWGAYQRAKLVTELRDTHSLETGEVASRLAMTAHEVNRRYRAFKALQQMASDDEYGDLATPDLYRLFHEAVAGSVVKEWLGWNETTSAFENAEALRQFYALITPRQGDDGDEREPKISSYDHVRELREILPLAEARRSLFDTDSSFQAALAIAKAEDLKRTWTTQVAEAIAALEGIGAVELTEIDPSAISLITRLVERGRAVLDIHALLTEHGPGES